MYRHLPGMVVLVLALLWAQLLGLAHGVMHGHAPAQAAPGQAALAWEQAPAHDLLSHLQAPADEENECRLYDQLGQGSPLSQWPHWSATALPHVVPWAVLVAGTVQPCAAFAARAPPQSR